MKTKPIPKVQPIQGSNRVLARLEKPLIEPFLRWSKPQKLRGLSQGLREAERSLRKYPRRMWDWSPKPGTHWCIREVLWHLADSEANYYVRLRRAAAESGATISPWDENRWALAVPYRKQSAALAWETFRALRTANIAWVKILSPGVWNRRVRHPDFGVMSIDRIVGACNWHTKHHQGQMERRYLEWKVR